MYVNCQGKRKKGGEEYKDNACLLYNVVNVLNYCGIRECHGLPLFVKNK